MAVARTIGPKVTQPVMYVDAVYGPIAAIITAVNATTGTITVITFPPGQSPVPQTGAPYDYTGAIVGSWHYHDTDVV